MISIDLFKIDGRFARGMRNTKIIYSAIRYGAKGIAKVSPVLVCVDVVLSLADMIHSYGQYRAAKEQTKQLEIIRNTLRKQYENLLIELRLDKQKLRLQLAQDLEKIDARIHKNILTLGIAHLMLKCRTTPNHLVLQEVRELPENFTEKFNDKIFPLERGITFVYEKEKGRYNELAVASGVGMEDMLVYIQTQMRLSQYQKPEYDPFKKWQQIIEHQIQTNSYTQISYRSYTQKNHQYTFKTTDPKIEKIESAIEAKVDGFVGEKAVQRTGKVIGGVDKTNKEICIEFKPLGVTFPQEWSNQKYLAILRS